jgi:AcrR family transcriptional regulator
MIADDPPSGVRRERRDVQRNLERVLQAAQELFAERGADVKMEEVARRAGVGVGTIYRRFPSKEQLFAAVSEDACQRTRTCLTQAAAATADPLEKLRAIIAVQYRQSAQMSALLDMRPDQPEHNHTPALSQPGLYAALHSLLARVIAAGQRQGSLRAGDPLLLAAICLELLSPHTVQQLSRLAGGDVEAAADQVIHFMLAGLRS